MKEEDRTGCRCFLIGPDEAVTRSTADLVCAGHSGSWVAELDHPGINYWLKSRLLEAIPPGERAEFWLGGHFYCLIHFYKRSSLKDGQAHQEGRNHWKVRHQVRSLPEEDREEDGDFPALQVHLHLLRQGQDEEAGHWHLVVQRQELQDPGGRRCLHLHHHRRGFHQVCREEIEGDEGGLNVAPNHP